MALLERLAMNGGGAAGLLVQAASDGVVQEAAVLSTCNRTELYLVASDAAGAEQAAREALSARAGTEDATLPAAVRSSSGSDAVAHLFRVTAGLESMAVGETEVQGQVKRAYERALREGLTGPIINRLFRGALQAGKRVRSAADWRSPPSVASLGVRLSLRRVGELGRLRVVVIGAGENAEATGRALARHGVRPVFVASRRHARAVALARRLGGRPVGFQSLRTELVDADVAFGCTSSQQPIVARHELARVMEERRGRPLLLIDTALPRDVDPAAREIPGVELYDIDDLKREAERDEPPAAPARAEQIIDEEVRRFQAWLGSLDVVPAISALRAHADAAVNQVLHENEASWEELSERDRERVEIVARAVASRLLHEPTMTLKRAAGSAASAAYVQAVQGLLGASEDPVTPPARDGQARRAAPSGSGPWHGWQAAGSTGG